MDTVDPKRRSEIMARVKSAHTSPELAVRRLAHGMGYRYRLHVRNLLGKPDLVFAGKRKIIFVHGCFWHRHRNCALARLPKSRIDFWRSKLEGNATRDARNIKLLRGEGWSVMVIWECQIKKTARLATRIRRFLDA